MEGLGSRRPGRNISWHVVTDRKADLSCLYTCMMLLENLWDNRWSRFCGSKWRERLLGHYSRRNSIFVPRLVKP